MYCVLSNDVRDGLSLSHLCPPSPSIPPTLPLSQCLLLPPSPPSHPHPSLPPTYSSSHPPHPHTLPPHSLQLTHPHSLTPSPSYTLTLSHPPPLTPSPSLSPSLQRDMGYVTTLLYVSTAAMPDWNTKCGETVDLPVSSIHYHAHQNCLYCMYVCMGVYVDINAHIQCCVTDM